MNTHDCAYVAGQVAPTGCDCEVLDRIQPVGVDHEVAVVLEYGRGLASVSIVEELGKSLAFDVVDGVHVKPGAVAGKHDRMSLGDQMFSSSILDGFFRLRIHPFSLPTVGVRVVLRRVAHVLVSRDLRPGPVGGVKGVIRGNAWRRRGAVLLDSRLGAVPHLDICNFMDTLLVLAAKTRLGRGE
jgi:hypothetical protein